MSRLLKSLIILLTAGTAHAQMAHEILVLVNKNSQDSLLVANTFVALRDIPKRNVVYLDLPERVYKGTATISPEEFTELIWEPANAAAVDRGIDDNMMAWIYSVDFPIRVKTDPSDRRQMSVTGLTFMRNRIPDLKMVEDGKYFSKLFGGPNSALKANIMPMAMAVYKSGMGKNASGIPPEASYLLEGLQEEMPLPSMMLGYTGENGSTVESVLQCLRTGKASDWQRLTEGVYFITSDDVRSTCREWQFYPTVNELNRIQVKAVVTTNFPAGAENVAGLLMGAETVDPSAIGSFAPGAMAEHLTSWSAEFQKPQTKVTSWIDAGATATAGAVVEPYSIPDKFPSARFYVYYLAGCTMIESFYQSIACPLQILLLGDPLAKPNALPFSLKLLGTSRIDKDFTFLSVAQSRFPRVEFFYTFLLDGKQVGEWSEDPTLYLRAVKLADGYHELRVVACIKHPILFSQVAVKPFVVDIFGRSVSILPDIRKTDSFTHAIKVEVGGDEMPEHLKLVCGELVLDEKPYAADAELLLNERIIGEGPNRIRVVAVYEDGMEVSSPPLNFEIKFNPES